jgi:hypothetical protein
LSSLSTFGPSSSLKKKLSLNGFERGGQANLPGASTDQEEIQEPGREKSKKLEKSVDYQFQ